MPKKTKYTKELLEPLVKECFSWSGLLRMLGLKQSGGNHRSIKTWVIHHDIDTSHFKGQGWSRGETKETNEKVNIIANKLRYSDEEVFKKGSTMNTNGLKKRLLKNHDWKYECSICGITEWLGEEITLHLDHIDGDHMNNEMKNLRFLCPNCHQQTITWGNKSQESEEDRKIKFKKKHKNRKCLDCDEKIYRTSTRCKICESKQRSPLVRKVERPPYEQLCKEIEETNYCVVGRKYGVSDNAIRKWIKHYEKYGP